MIEYTKFLFRCLGWITLAVVLWTIGLNIYLGASAAELGIRAVECRSIAQPHKLQTFRAVRCPGGWAFVRHVWVQR